MSYISWEEIYSVNNRELDSQHKTIIRLINELSVGDSESEQIGSIEKVLYELVKYTAYHFSYEENLMVQFGYPNTRAHILQHNYLIEKLKQFMIRNGDKNHLPANDLMIFLSDWLKSHIMGVDKFYSTLLGDLSVN